MNSQPLTLEEIKIIRDAIAAWPFYEINWSRCSSIGWRTNIAPGGEVWPPVAVVLHRHPELRDRIPAVMDPLEDTRDDDVVREIGSVINGLQEFQRENGISVASGRIMDPAMRPALIGELNRWIASRELTDTLIYKHFEGRDFRLGAYHPPGSRAMITNLSATEKSDD